MEKITVLIIEDHATTRLGLRVELSQEADIDVVEVAGTVEEGIQKCTALRPQVILLDLHLPDSKGPKSLISTFVPMAKVVVFSAEGSKTIIRKIMELGATGFVSKSDSTAQLLSTIRNAALDDGQVVRGGDSVSPSAKNLVIDPPPMSSTTSNEFEDPNIGRIVDERYRVTEVLGFGSYSVVYKAQDLQSNRAVALKILHTHLALIKEAAGRFHREAQTCQKLQHPNIAAIYSSGQTETGQPYLAMEFVQGASLDRELQRVSKMHSDRVVTICTQICNGLEAAHSLGIVHRDVKPANIHLAHEDVVKVLDFGLVKVISGEGTGIASLTASGATIGTPCYMSPEQCHGEDLDGRSDIYAVGCIIYELLSGRRLFDGNTIVDVMMQHINSKPNLKVLTDADVPTSLIAIVEKALQKDRKLRFKSARELSEQLEVSVNADAKKLSLFKWPS